MLKKMDKPKSKIERVRQQLYIIIFGTDTPAGKKFDIALLWAIVLSTLALMLESVREISNVYGTYLLYAEYFFTGLFTVEFILRLWTSRKPWGYVFSFYGIVDILSILPTYITIFFINSQFLTVIRIFRLMRVFRVLKLGRSMREADVLWTSLKASRAKIGVFLFAVFNIAVIMGTIMYIVEGGDHGFTSIPRSIYWAIVTMTTVGFGDIHPDLGQFFALILMILGYGIIAVPTGIVGVDMIATKSGNLKGELNIQKHCDNCGQSGHLEDAVYCRKCGGHL
jgi:voltage-gated potassium channel